MAREYGYLPSEVLGETSLPKGTRFHLNFDIYAATALHIQEKREEQREEMDPSSNRVGSRQERNAMIQGKTELAEQREQMEQAGMEAPSPQGQMSTLEELKQERAEAKQIQDQIGGVGPEGDGDR